MDSDQLVYIKYPGDDVPEYHLLSSGWTTVCHEQVAMLGAVIRLDHAQKFGEVCNKCLAESREDANGTS